MGHNKFYFLRDTETNLTLPTGNYEIDDVERQLKEQLAEHNVQPFSLTADEVTLTTQIKVPSDILINFIPQDSIGRLLGFKPNILSHSNSYKSDMPASIIHINAIRIDCNITAGAYINNHQVHTIHEFFPDVATGSNIIEVPAQVIYLPIVVKSIGHLQVKIVDQDGQLVNFRGEIITIRLHIKAN